MKETNFVLCKCVEDVFLEVIANQPVLGHRDEFVMHMGDFFSLTDELQAKIEYSELYTK